MRQRTERPSVKYALAASVSIVFLFSGCGNSQKTEIGNKIQESATKYVQNSPMFERGRLREAIGLRGMETDYKFDTCTFVVNELTDKEVHGDDTSYKVKGKISGVGHKYRMYGINEYIKIEGSQFAIKDIEVVTDVVVNSGGKISVNSLH